MYKSHIYFKKLDPFIALVYVYLIKDHQIIHQCEFYCDILCKYQLIDCFRKGWIDCITFHKPFYWYGGLRWELLSDFRILLWDYDIDKVKFHYGESISSNEELERVLNFM